MVQEDDDEVVGGIIIIQKERRPPDVSLVMLVAVVLGVVGGVALVGEGSILRKLAGALMGAVVAVLVLYGAAVWLLSRGY